MLSFDSDGVNMCATIKMRPHFPPKPQKAVVALLVFSDNAGNALAHATLTDDTNKIIYRSEV